ncbi:MAG TPA: VOC family protein [Micropepsaceae bacterium]|nr:VOC family protein [Micropepsaceae bacterium]
MTRIGTALGCALVAAFGAGQALAADALPPPGFHHLELNSVDPDAAIAFYVKEFPSTSKTTWAGMPALASPNNVLVLFKKVDKPPISDPQITAFWHFGWHVTDVRKNMADYLQRREVTLAPLYTTDEGGSVLVSSDSWPGTGGILGLTKAQIADARAKGVKPLGGAGFAYLNGPDGTLIEYQGNMPKERFNHVHMYQEDPFCARVWYQTHLNAPSPQTPATAPKYTEANCKVARSADRTWPALERQGMFRTPTTGVTFGDVAMNWYMRQTDAPLVSTRGHLMDHVGLSVANLDAWAAKLRAEGVKFLEQPHKLGDTRAFMIEGPSREAIELVEVK